MRRQRTRARGSFPCASLAGRAETIVFEQPADGFPVSGDVPGIDQQSFLAVPDVVRDGTSAGRNDRLPEAQGVGDRRVAARGVPCEERHGHERRAGHEREELVERHPPAHAALVGNRPVEAERLRRVRHDRQRDPRAAHRLDQRAVVAKGASSGEDVRLACLMSDDLVEATVCRDRVVDVVGASLGFDPRVHDHTLRVAGPPGPEVDLVGDDRRYSDDSQAAEHEVEGNEPVRGAEEQELRSHDDERDEDPKAEQRGVRPVCAVAVDDPAVEPSREHLALP